MAYHDPSVQLLDQSNLFRVGLLMGTGVIRLSVAWNGLFFNFVKLGLSSAGHLELILRGRHDG